MDRFWKPARRLWRDEDGASAIEYGLLVGLIAIAIVSGVTALGGATSNSFNAVENSWPEN